MTTRECEYDLLVAGSGAAGFSAAVTAAHHGLNVLMVEKAPVFGGSTCFSAGMVWIPDSRQAREAGVRDDRDAALRYLEAEAGNHLQRDPAAAYVRRGAEILEWFETHTAVRFQLSPVWPDYHPMYPGGMSGGRSLGPAPFDGRQLGLRFHTLRPPLATTMLFGGMMIGREDLSKFYTVTRSVKSAMHVGGLYLRFLRDRMSWPRGTRLSNGNALIAALAHSAFARNVALALQTSIVELIQERGRVTGARVRGPDGETIVTARHGVVLACGGFPANADRQREVMPHVAQGKAHVTVAPAMNAGDGVRLGEAIGTALVADQISPVAWTPVSLVPQPDGTTIPFPHFNDRGKAGYICVDRRGRRFVSEAVSYHDFVPAMLAACAQDDDVACWVLCDSEAITRHGLGRVPVSPGRIAPFVRSGYVTRGATLRELAQSCGVDPAGLETTVARFNEFAARGEDPDFGKGKDVYERFNGTPGHRPNPCLKPIVQGPFYAVKLVPGDIGTFVGLRADADARALDATGRVIDGLYVAGNDAGSCFGGTYPGAGTSIGPAMVFGHLAALHAAGVGSVPA
jgi:succinate dehydrogenase/fumarate reductase flavoprotein subunit